MKKINNVIGSYEASSPLIVGKTTVYVHTNIVKIEDEKQPNLYVYDEVQYTKDEYIKLLSEKNDELDNQLVATQLALCDIYESMEV